MNLHERIELLSKLGDQLPGDEYLEAIFHRTSFHNPWFTFENQKKALEAIVAQFLSKEKLEHWVSRYPEISGANKKTVGLILAGNIPFVGMHDLISVFISGHKSKIKLSEKDAFVLPYLVEKMKKINPEAATYFEIVEMLKDFDAAIATGSNNSGRYFEAYFKKYPSIIRKNRNSVAVLTGEESDAELLALGSDIFQYFGLGCRNVSKLYLPENYDLEKLLEILHEYKSVALHEKYKNNFDYNFAMLTLNKVPFLFSGSILLIEDESLNSRIASLHFEKYASLQNIENQLIEKSNELQCVVGKPGIFEKIETTPFGKTQSPTLFDYADGVDTLAFLVALK